MSSNQLAAFNYGVPPYANLPIKTITAAYRVQPSDNGWIINCTSGTFSVSMPAAATLGSGFNCTIWNTSVTDSHVITIDPNSTETIDGKATILLRRGEGTQIICDGSNWQTGNKKSMRGYSENVSSASVYAIASADGASAIGQNANASGVSSIALGQSSASSGTASIALGFGSTASGAYAFAASGATASSNASTAIGQNSSFQTSQAVTGTGAMALGGSYASGTDSFAAAIANNTSTYGAKGTNSIALGLNTVATGTRSVAIGRNCSSSGLSAVAIGGDSTASDAYTVAIGNAIASSTGSTALGKSTSNILNKYTFNGGFNSVFVSSGDCQTGTFVLRGATTDATAKILTTNDSTAAADNQVIPPNNSAYAFTGTVVARRQASGGTASAAWKIEGLIRREGAANTTTLVASTVTAISNVPGWTLALSADTTNGGLKVEATGAASTNIRWVATVQTSEVTYA